ncbi:MAG: helix-turn-helix domain-containing protein [Alicyclobacillus sp.]|nr:helix-turn-helix domain-containing protein [Alicyclobacillus sp.]
MVLRRRDLNMTQQELAEKVGTSRSLIAYIEQGKKHPSLPVALRIAKVLDMNVETLFQGDGIDEDEN